LATVIEPDRGYNQTRGSNRILCSSFVEVDRMAELIGQNRKGNALLCRAWGETEVPVVEVVHTTSGLRDFIAEVWLGSDDDPEMGEIVHQIDEHNFSADDASVFSFEFEIGGASFEDVSG
jgi:hypothetical protein